MRLLYLGSHLSYAIKLLTVYRSANYNYDYFDNKFLIILNATCTYGL